MAQKVTGPRGTQDVSPYESYKWLRLENKLRSIVGQYGFKEIRVPTFEHTELFLRGVGAVSYTHLFSKVSTILNSSVSAGCYVGENLDVGIAGGSYDLSKSDMCAVQYLPKTSRAKEGDLVSTSGYGTVFPSGLIIGKVKEVTVDAVSYTHLTCKYHYNRKNYSYNFRIKVHLTYLTVNIL